MNVGRGGSLMDSSCFSSLGCILPATLTGNLTNEHEVVRRMVDVRKLHDCVRAYGLSDSSFDDSLFGIPPHP